MARKKPKPVRTRRGESCRLKPYRVSEDESGRLTCFDGCGKPAPLDKCAGLTMSPDSTDIKFAFKRSCRVEPQVKEHLQARVNNGTEFKYED